MNNLILCVKKNDQPVVGNKNRGMKHLMPVFWWDERTMGNFILQSDTNQMDKFIHFIVNRSLANDVKQWCAPTEEGDPLTLNNGPIRDRAYYFDEVGLARALNLGGDPNEIIPFLRNGHGVTLINATGVDFKAHVKLSKDRDWDRE